MAYFTISVSFTHYTDPLLEDKAELIIASITGNEDFENAGSFLDKVITATKAFADARGAAANKGTQDIANKNIARAPLEVALKNLGYYLMAEASGDEGKLKKTGYTMAKIGSPAIIHAPLNVVVTPGPTSGSMNISVDVVTGNHIYVFQYCTSAPTPETTWISEPVTTSKITLYNLQPGTLHYVRVGAKDSRNITLYSFIVSQYCL